MVAEEAHDRKLQKSLKVCEEEGIHFVPTGLGIDRRRD